MPMEPTDVTVDTISTSSLKTSPSGVRTSTLKVVRATLAVLLRGLDDVLDLALEQEGRLGQVVVLALEDLLERADRVADRHVRAGRARELLRDVERLRQEALDLAGALDEHAVLVGQLVDA